MKILEIALRGVELKFSREHDWYTDDFYHLVANDSWEPSTVAFFERNMDRNTVLLDIGSATGVLAMFAAKLGANVIAFEPNPVAVKILRKNIELNQLGNLISVIPDAVSDSDSVMKFSVGANSAVLSPIVMHGMEKHESTEIRVQNIIDVVDKYSKGTKAKLIVKMDIEGAEYRMLCNSNVVNSISKKISKLYVSFHPGFNRPTNSSSRYVAYLISKLKYAWVLQDHYKVFKNLGSNGVIVTTDGRVVDRFSTFAGLLCFGNHDWIWEPTKKRV